MHTMLRNIAAFFVLCSFNALSAEEYTPQIFNQSSVLELLNAGDDAVLHIDESNGKAYINPQTIVPTDHGLFLKAKSGKYFELPVLLSSSQGCYTLISQSDATVYPVIRCRNCGLPFSPTIFNRGKCPSCGAQN